MGQVNKIRFTGPDGKIYKVVPAIHLTLLVIFPDKKLYSVVGFDTTFDPPKPIGLKEEFNFDPHMTVEEIAKLKGAVIAEEVVSSQKNEKSSGGK